MPDGPRPRRFAVSRVVSAVKFAASELKGQYQTLVEAQAVVRGDPDDPDLIVAVLAATQSRFGPQGAYHAIDTGQYRNYR